MAHYRHDFSRFDDRETFALSVVIHLSDMLDAMFGPEDARQTLAMV